MRYRLELSASSRRRKTYYVGDLMPSGKEVGALGQLTSVC